ncbi:MAG: hypothetical protein M3063_08140 [Actinomycetota bacterium]|nr:hypothetical protein [Actinomycetota bacterium]
MLSCFIVVHGSLWFEKRAETANDEDRIRHERLMLGLAAHTGVVTTPDPFPNGAAAVLRTRAVRGRPLAAMDALSTPEIAGLGAALATTVADLHATGISHGALHDGHILVDGAGRPVLCGFSAARTGTETHRRAADVGALGRTLATLLPGAGPETGGDVDPSSGRGLSQPRGWRRTEGPEGPLARLLDEVGSGGRPMSARRLVERLNDRRFAPRLPCRGAGCSSPTVPRSQTVAGPTQR